MCRFRSDDCNQKCVCSKCKYDSECDGTGGDGCEEESYMSGCGSFEEGSDDI